MAKFSYIRPTKLHPEAEQTEVLVGERFDEEFVDETPKRGEPAWFWREQVIRACRHGSGDEIWVSHASVIADSASQALDKLSEITARGAVLVVASTGKRYKWHQDAALAMELAREMEREARREVARKGGEAFARNAAARRKRKEVKMQVAEDLWRNKVLSTEDVMAKTGLTRHALYKRFGPRGTPRFGKATR